VELTGTEELFTRPLHPYTESLTSAIPIPDPHRRRESEPLKGEVADPAAPPSGCYFHPRCKYARDICCEEEPGLVDLSEGDEEPHLVACHFAVKLRLKPVLAS